MITKHLDLDSVAWQRNRYHCNNVHAVVLTAHTGMGSWLSRQANLSVEAIPYPDFTSDSISAFDFLQPIPKVLTTTNGKESHFPFIVLMNKVHATIRPRGFVHTSTPAYPHPAAFHEPTHVSFIANSRSGSGWFCGDSPLARIYGFCENAEELLNDWAMHSKDYAPGTNVRWRCRLPRWRRKQAGRVSDLVWESGSVKPIP